MKYAKMTWEQLATELGAAHELVVELKGQVSALKRALKERQRDEEKYQIFFSLTNDAMFSYDYDLKVTAVSPNTERLIGYRPDEIVGRYFYDLGIIHPEDLGDAMEEALSALTGRIVHNSIHRFITKDSRVMFVELNRIPLKRRGKVVELVSVARDITDRIERERIIREGQETARVLLDASNDTSLLLDCDGNVIAVNEPAARRFGKNARELQGADIFRELPGRTAHEVRSAMQEVVRTGNRVVITAEPLGSPLSITLYPIRDVQGKVSRIAANARDLPADEKGWR